MDSIDLLRHYREGAQVERAHTVRHIGSYSVGEHSHGVATILALFHPNPSAELLKAALFHDLHEVHTGDVPAFAKMLDFTQLEKEVQEVLGTDICLDEEEQNWFRAADALDLLLWCREQQEMGNRNVDRIHEHVLGHLENDSSVPEPLLQVVHEYTAKRSWPIGARDDR